jgi:Fe2+ or Zn2+ uptake regulation protein
MSASIEEILLSLKENGFDISLVELEEILGLLVKEGIIKRETSTGFMG